MIDQIIVSYVLSGKHFVVRTDPRVQFLMNALFKNSDVTNITTRVYSR